MDDNHGDLEIDENRLKAADPDGLYLFMLKDYPYMMTPDNVAAFTGTTGQEIRKLLNRGDTGMPHRRPLARSEARASELPLQRSPTGRGRFLCH